MGKKQVDGFTLIEILIVLAIISILSGAVLVSVQGQREKAQVSKVLSEISARLQPMMMCWSDGGSVSIASLCNLGGSYGSWPTLPTGFGPMQGAIASSSSWSIYIDGGGARICCTSAMSQCSVLAIGAVCVAGTTWN